MFLFSQNWGYTLANCSVARLFHLLQQNNRQKKSSYYQLPEDYRYLGLTLWHCSDRHRISLPHRDAVQSEHIHQQVSCADRLVSLYLQVSCLVLHRYATTLIWRESCTIITRNLFVDVICWSWKVPCNLSQLMIRHWYSPYDPSATAHQRGIKLPMPKVFLSGHAMSWLQFYVLPRTNDRRFCFVSPTGLRK